jgi:hypothetical protein
LIGSMKVAVFASTAHLVKTLVNLLISEQVQRVLSILLILMI